MPSATRWSPSCSGSARAPVSARRRRRHRGRAVRRLGRRGRRHARRGARSRSRRATGASAQPRSRTRCVLEAALDAAPWMREPHTYRAWESFSDGPYEEPTRRATADHDVETPTARAAVGLDHGGRAAACARVALRAPHERIRIAGHGRACRARVGSSSSRRQRGVSRGSPRSAATRRRRRRHRHRGHRPVRAPTTEDVPPGARAGDVDRRVAGAPHVLARRTQVPSALVDLGDDFERHPAPPTTATSSTSAPARAA